MIHSKDSRLRVDPPRGLGLTHPRERPAQPGKRGPPTFPFPETRLPHGVPKPKSAQGRRDLAGPPVRLGRLCPLWSQVSRRNRTDEEKQQILEKKREDISNYFKKRRIMIDQFQFVYFNTDNLEQIESNDNAMKMIIELVTGRDLIIKKVEKVIHQKKNYQQIPKNLQRTTPPINNYSSLNSASNSS